jgi:ketosteroid isomerase-like protein
MKNTPEAIVREFWRLMASNDFNSVKAVLSDEFVMDWPQSKERIRGADNFTEMNNDYPTTSQWSFRINRLVAHGHEVVTQVSLTDGTQSAEPVSFFTVESGKITKLVEYWPDPFEPKANRRHLAEIMQ